MLKNVRPRFCADRGWASIVDRSRRIAAAGTCRASGAASAAASPDGEQAGVAAKAQRHYTRLVDCSILGEPLAEYAERAADD